jgi:hypothetical protein
MSRPNHCRWFYLPNNIWGWVQNMKLLIVQLSPFSLGPCSQTPLLYALPLMWETTFHTHTKQLTEIWFLYILTFTFLYSRKEDKRLWTDWRFEP